MEFISSLLAKEPAAIQGRNKKVFDYSSASDSFDFYHDQFTGKADEESFKIGAKLSEEVSLAQAPVEMQAIIAYLQKQIDEEAVVVELGGSKHQRRSGFPFKFFKNYLPLDISLSSMVAYSELYDRPSIACDAHSLPFKDASVDAVFTHTFLEHPKNPDQVVKEIDRILKPGGVVIHADAWNCRWWQRYGIYKVKKWTDLNAREKIHYMTAAVSEFRFFRIPVILFRRLWRHVFVSRKSPIDLHFKALKPNYELKIYSDEDAAGSIDPIDLVHFYESRGYTYQGPNSLKERILFNGAFVTMRKS